MTKSRILTQRYELSLVFFLSVSVLTSRYLHKIQYTLLFAKVTMAIAREVASVTRLGIEVGYNFSSAYSVIIYCIIINVFFYLVLDILILSPLYFCSCFSVYAKGLYIKICRWSYMKSICKLK